MKQTPPGSQIDRISIQGFRSIKSCNLQLRGINILIGANGAGKSNFISVFSMIQQIFEKRLQNYVTYNGGPDALLWYGRKETEKLSVGIYFGNNGYGFDLKPTRDNQLMFEDEWFSWDMLNEKRSLGTGHLESRMSPVPEHISMSMCWHMFTSGKSITSMIRVTRQKSNKSTILTTIWH
jgi:predicted ATPase